LQFRERYARNDCGHGLSALRRLKQEVYEFKASLGYITRLYFKKEKRNDSR
jgi:hypothetical protein